MLSLINRDRCRGSAPPALQHEHLGAKILHRGKTGFSWIKPSHDALNPVIWPPFLPQSIRRDNPRSGTGFQPDRYQKSYPSRQRRAKKSTGTNRDDGDL